MKKNTPEVLSFFTSNPKTDVLYFTCDTTPGVLSLGFFEQNHAQVHATNLAKKNPALNVVTVVTRAEAEMVDPTTETPLVELTPLEQAQANKDAADELVKTTLAAKDAAQMALDQAQGAKDNPPTGATGADKAKLTKAFNKATGSLADATEAYNNAVIDQQTATDALAALSVSGK